MKVYVVSSFDAVFVGLTYRNFMESAFGDSIIKYSEDYQDFELALTLANWSKTLIN